MSFISFVFRLFAS